MKRLAILALYGLILFLAALAYGAWQHERGLRVGIAVGRASCAMALDDARRLAVEAIAEADSCCGRDND